MKPHPELTIEEIIKVMSDPENLPNAADGRPIPLEERLEAKEGVLRAFQENKVLIGCIACGQEASIKECTPCICGGFVCDTCRAMETEGECNHERPSFHEV